MVMLACSFMKFDGGTCSRMSHLNIEATLKIKSIGKEWISGILFFDGKRSCLRSRHLVLWSLGTLTGQQRFYGTGLVTQKEKYYNS